MAEKPRRTLLFCSAWCSKMTSLKRETSIVVFETNKGTLKFQVPNRAGQIRKMRTVQALRNFLEGSLGEEPVGYVTDNGEPVSLQSVASDPRRFAKVKCVMPRLFGSSVLYFELVFVAAQLKHFLVNKAFMYNRIRQLKQQNQSTGQRYRSGT